MVVMANKSNISFDTSLRDVSTICIGGAVWRQATFRYRFGCVFFRYGFGYFIVLAFKIKDRNKHKWN